MSRMNIIEKLLHDDIEIRRSALDAFVDARIAFDTFKLYVLIEFVTLTRKQSIEDVARGMTEINNHLNKQIKPLHGQMMTEKRR